MTTRLVKEERVKVRILASRRIDWGKTLVNGDKVKVPESQAQAWIANGWAELVGRRTK